jgi:hypothetical protein
MEVVEAAFTALNAYSAPAISFSISINSEKRRGGDRTFQLQ